MYKQKEKRTDGRTHTYLKRDLLTDEWTPKLPWKSGYVVLTLRENPGVNVQGKEEK
ncbi:Hypothetical protein FKW44_022888 [Caligus rogercresseyi]|uniref:Uncharacterized protein n=1 Tax=Caligus rogercresseyi TaxID=217165 RepID=A0A7T8GN30_CALRO|nr:Hypothetical protein FKW44_022888 [Caligus rogercresseyi]